MNAAMDEAKRPFWGCPTLLSRLFLGHLISAKAFFGIFQGLFGLCVLGHLITKKASVVSFSQVPLLEFLGPELQMGEGVTLCGSFVFPVKVATALVGLGITKGSVLAPRGCRRGSCECALGTKWF